MDVIDKDPKFYRFFAKPIIRFLMRIVFNPKYKLTVFPTATAFSSNVSGSFIDTTLLNISSASLVSPIVKYRCSSSPPSN